MAAIAGTDTVNISINGIPLTVPKGELIVEAVKRLGLEIPIFCYHARMKPVGMCRMCLVEVGFPGPDGSIRKMPKPQAGCTLPASEGMAIFTDTEQIHRDRKGVLEFLLVNHPLDCPVCDRGGECPLQNNTLFYGPSTSRYLEIKRHLPKAFPLSQHVTLDLERCIQCGRCVRFTEEISGDSQLAFRFRGAQMQPSTFELRNFESKFSGNVIEICPVGALTNAEYRFRARPWDLETKPAVCTQCSNGCNIWFDYRVGKMVRINGRTNEAINEEWTCDRGKFGHEFYNSSLRLSRVLVRNGDALMESDWGTAYDAIKLAFVNGGDKVAVLAGPGQSNEELYLLRELFNKHFGSQMTDHRWTAQMAEPTVSNTIASLEEARSILVFGTSLADELPIVYLRVRKAWFQNGAKVVVAADKPSDVDSFAHLVLRYRPGTGSVLAKGLQKLVASGTAPGSGIEQISATTGVPVELLTQAAEIVAGATTITTQGILGEADGIETLTALKALSGSFNNYVLGANDQGAFDLGFVPSGTANTHDILTQCAEGGISALWLVGANPLTLHPDRELVERALEAVGFLVYQHHSETEAMGYASIVLPQAAPGEQDGTYTNCERRVQRMRPILPPKGSAKPGWRICTELAMRIAPAVPPFGPADVMKIIGQTVAGYAAADYANLEDEGVVIH